MMTAEQKALVVDRVKFLYKAVCERKSDGGDPNVAQTRGCYVSEMERLMRTHFINTKDFHAKIRRFLGV